MRVAGDNGRAKLPANTLAHLFSVDQFCTVKGMEHDVATSLQGSSAKKVKGRSREVLLAAVS